MVQTLKEYMRKTLNEMISHMEGGIIKTRETLRTLEAMDMDRAEFIVNLHSLSEDEGEKAVTKQYTGTLKDAVEKTRKEFRSKYGEDIQVKYLVEIFIGERGYIIPEEYLFQFIERPCSG